MGISGEKSYLVYGFRNMQLSAQLLRSRYVNVSLHIEDLVALTL